MGTDDRDQAEEKEDRELHKAVWKCDTDAEVIALIRSREAPLLAGKREAEAIKRAWDLVAAEFPGPHEGWAADGPGELMVQAVRSLRAQLASANAELETMKAERNEARRMWDHYQDQARIVGQKLEDAVARQGAANARVEEQEDGELREVERLLGEVLNSLKGRGQDGSWERHCYRLTMSAYVRMPRLAQLLAGKREAESELEMCRAGFDEAVELRVKAERRERDYAITLRRLLAAYRGEVDTELRDAAVNAAVALLGNAPAGSMRESVDGMVALMDSDRLIRELEKALRKFGQHSYSCDWNKHCSCTCGFSAAIPAARKPSGPKHTLTEQHAEALGEKLPAARETPSASIKLDTESLEKLKHDIRRSEKLPDMGQRVGAEARETRFQLTSAKIAEANREAIELLNEVRDARETPKEAVMSCGHTVSWHALKGRGPEPGACGYMGPATLRKCPSCGAENCNGGAH